MLLGEAGHGAGLALAGKRAASDRTPHRSGSAPYHSGRSQHWIKMKGGDLRVAPSARAANSLLPLPPFPPAAERCAFTCVESIICVSVDRPFLASSLNRFSQMPRRAQRTKRL